MIKSVKVKILTIEYRGDSIGDDIRVEIELMGRFLRVDKTIKAGTNIEINGEIGSFETEEKIFEAVTRITVIEKDLLFNDVGSTDGKIKIDTNSVNSQQFVYKIQVKETRSILGKTWGEATAIFEVTLRVDVEDAMRYVGDEGDGWLSVTLENSKPPVSLPAYLKVKPERMHNKREYFTILEGAYRGKSASVKLGSDGLSNFVSNIQHERAVLAIYSISSKTLNINGNVYTATDYKDVPWEKGLYDIEIPDAPHRFGANYPEAKRPKTWFRIGHSGERYLHTGLHSLGCLTIIEITRWMEIYNTLIRARKGDLISVGVLEVVD